MSFPKTPDFLWAQIKRVECHIFVCHKKIKSFYYPYGFAYEKCCEDLKWFEQELRDLQVEYAEATTPSYFPKVIKQVDKSQVALWKATDREILNSMRADLKNIQTSLQKIATITLKEEPSMQKSETACAIQMEDLAMVISEVAKTEIEEVAQLEDQVLGPVVHEDIKKDTIGVEQLDFLLLDGVFKCNTGSKFFIMSMLFPKIVLVELGCGMFHVCAKTLRSWFLILNYYKTRGRVFFNGGENDAEQKRKIKRLITYYFILLFRDKYWIINVIILVGYSRSFNYSSRF